MQAYVYQPLPPKTIRVLRLNPDMVDDIQDKLEIIKLQKGFFVQKYNALWYCWGVERDTRDITIDGDVFKVRPNLNSVLLRLRKKAFKLPIWVDAICINQEDEAEKVKQIQLMPEIYSTGKNVIIWLGEESINTEAAAKVLKSIEWRGLNPGYFKRNPMSEGVERGIGEMLTSQWWSRLWVLQEAIKAQNRLVLCGSHFVDFEALGFAVSYFADNLLIESYLTSADTERELTGFDGIRKIQEYETAMRIGGWWAATEPCRERGCSQPKDRIYAIHGIVPGIEERLQGLRSYRFEPEATVKDLYIPFTVMHLDPYGKTIRTAPAQVKDPSLPTWCADYHRTRVQEPKDLDDRSTTAAEFQKLSHDNTKGLGKTYGWCQDNPEVLYITALLVDKVEQIVPYTWENVYGDRKRARFSGGLPTALENSRANNLEWLAMCTEASRHSIEVFDDTSKVSTGNPDLQKDLWTILSSHRQSPKPAKSSAASNREQCYSMLQEGGVHQSAELPACFEDFNAFTVLDTLCSGRRFFTTASGCFGLGPATMEVGDQICVMRGGNMSFILRRSIDHERAKSRSVYFHMIGEAVVYGYSLPDVT